MVEIGDSDKVGRLCFVVARNSPASTVCPRIQIAFPIQLTHLWRLFLSSRSGTIVEGPVQLVLQLLQLLVASSVVLVLQILVASSVRCTRKSNSWR